MGSREDINLEKLLEETEEGNSDFDRFPGPIDVVGHELRNWAQKSYLDGPEVAELYNEYKAMLENSAKGRDELISEIEEVDNKYSDIVSTGFQAIEGYIDIFRSDKLGEVALGAFMDDLCYHNDIEIEYDSDQKVSGNEALFIPFCTMVKNSRQYFEGDIEDLEINIEAEDSQGAYTLIYTDNGPGIDEETRESMYEGFFYRSSNSG